MSPTVFELEWHLALSRTRRFVLNAAVPLALVIPAAGGGIPHDIASMLYVLLFTAFAMLGASVPLRWDGERGMVQRVVRGGVTEPSYMLQRAAASATLDFVQLLPALLAIAWGVGTSPVGLLRALASLLAATWIAALVGVLVASVSRSRTEAAIISTVTTLVLAHFSGVFRMPDPGSRGALLEAISPLRALHETLLGLPGGVPAAGGITVTLWSIGLPALVAALAGPVEASLGRVGRAGFEGA